MPNSSASLDDLNVFLAVLRRGGFRDAARELGLSPSTVSDTISRLEARLGARLLTRTTRSVAPTDIGRDLAARLAPLLAETAAAVDAALSTAGELQGRLVLNVPGAVMTDILPPILERFMARHPKVRVEVMVDDRMIDAVAAGCDAGIRYGEALAQDVIAVPIGPRRQQAALAASPAYLAARGMPAHPAELAAHDGVMVRFASGAMARWEFTRGQEALQVEPQPRLVIGAGAPAAVIGHALSGMGLCMLFRNWLEPHFESGALVPVLPEWWPEFDGPQLYFANRRLLPPPLRAFVDHLRSEG